MILVVASSSRERSLLTALCQSRHWTVEARDSVRAAERFLRRHVPRVLLVRHRLDDGFSDHLLSALDGTPSGPRARRIVLVAAGTSSVAEARQVELGADCVLRDPVRTEVLMAYVARFHDAARAARPLPAATHSESVAFAGGVLLPAERRFQHRERTLLLTPREVSLCESLARSAGAVVSYETLYAEILDRTFRGDTSNMRVLLGKLAASVRTIRINLRDWVEVIPKSGYRYRPASARRPVP